MTHDPNQEILDDPNITFKKRWQMLIDLDELNKMYGIYLRFIEYWTPWIHYFQFLRDQPISMLEIGSGAGGLSLQLKNWATKNDLALSVNLYDSQVDVLQESLKKFEPTQKPTFYVATDQHLKVFPDKSFDLVVSLQVIHHIRPQEMAVDCLLQSLRVARKGIFIADFRPISIIYQFAINMVNWSLGISKDLRNDGIKSLRRAYDLDQLYRELLKSDISQQYNFKLKKLIFFPYWLLIATRK